MLCLVLKVIKKKPIGMTASITKALITTAQPIMKASIIKASVVKVPTTNVIITTLYMAGKAVIGKCVLCCTFFYCYLKIATRVKCKILVFLRFNDDICILQLIQNNTTPSTNITQ